MATNLVYRNSDSKNRVQALAATYQSGVPVISLDGKPAVTVTASGDATKSEVISGVGTLSGIPNGGVGLTGKEVTLAFDGTWEFPVSGFDTTTNVGDLTQGQAINFKTSNGKLTTAAIAAGIVAFGTVDFPPDYDKTRGMAPVKIGG